MELRQLLFFVTIADTRNVRRAAERLNISQPPLTVAIKKLEQELGALLFERSSRGVRLTAAGQAALPSALAALAEAKNVRTAARDGSAGDRGALKLGFVGSCIFGLLPRLLPAFTSRYPGIELSLEESTTHEMIPALLSGALDVALVRLPLLDYAEVDLTVVEQDELLAAVPAGHPLAVADRIDLASIAEEAFVSLGRTSILRPTILQACHAAGFVPRIVQEVPQLSTVLCLVQSGLGIALVPAGVALSAPRGVRLLRLTMPPRIELGVAIRPTTASPAALNFRALAKAQFTAVAG